MRLPNVGRALEETHSHFPDLDPKEFNNAIYRFFEESDPLFSEIKWNLGQNYYVAKALGMDPSGKLLSSELFANAIIYLDTNVLIDALEPTRKHYHSFQTLTKSCRNQNIDLCVCQISLDELRKVVAFERDVIRKVENHIPDKTVPKIGGLLFPIYRAKLQSGQMEDLDQLFIAFDQPMDFLASFYNISLVDDNWFIEAQDDNDTEQLTSRIMQTQTAKPWRSKSKGSARHDAMLLRWIHRMRMEQNRNIYLVTLDRSLPGISVDEGNGSQAPAITLDALLQWMSPIAATENVENEFADIFSVAIRHHLLPQNIFFDTRDFLVFREMEWSTKELPADDVEDCIRSLKSAYPNLDPTDPADREKISREIAKFFADPGRKYKQEVQRLEKGVADLVDEKEREAGRYNSEIKELKKELETNNETIAKTSAHWRLLLATAIYVGAEALMVYLASQLGEGDNLWQKLLNSWQFFLIPVGVFFPIAWLLLGKQRLRALGWPFTKILKFEPDTPGKV